jgi:hypothetical protein
MKNLNPLIGVLVGVLVVLLGLALLANAEAALNPNQQWCLTDTAGHFWVLHIFESAEIKEVEGTISGHMILWGHVHLGPLRTSTEYVVGAGTIYYGGLKEGTAELAVEIVGAGLTAKVAGSLGTNPIVYRAMDGSNYMMTLLPNCNTHP